MSEDWKPGDLALCVKSATYTRSGNIYTVCAVSLPGQVDDGYETPPTVPYLRFYEVHLYSGRDWSDSSRFRKINPHTADAEDAETIRLLTGKPVEVVQ